MTRFVPVAKCPSCHYSVIYSGDPKAGRSLILKIAEDDFQGRMVLCAKCKTMLAIVEPQFVASEPTAVPALKSSSYRKVSHPPGSEIGL